MKTTKNNKKGVGKGNTNNPTGRPKGVPNKATQNGREAIAAFVDGNADRLTDWLDQIAQDNPKDAFNCFMSVVEYHIPKLQRTDMQQLDKNGKPADAVSRIVIEHVSAPKE